MKITYIAPLHDTTLDRRGSFADNLFKGQSEIGLDGDFNIIL